MKSLQRGDMLWLIVEHVLNYHALSWNLIIHFKLLQIIHDSWWQFFWFDYMHDGSWKLAVIAQESGYDSSAKRSQGLNLGLMKIIKSTTISFPMILQLNLF